MRRLLILAFTSRLIMCAAMAADAVLDVGDTFLAVFGNDPGLLMLMATIAGILLVIAPQMTCCAGSIVIAIEQEVAAVVECRGFPVRRLVACRAGQCLTSVQIIMRSSMTRLAVCAHVGLEQSVVECHRTGLGQSRLRVIAVAGHAVGLGERPVECGATIRLRKDHALGGPQADIRDDIGLSHSLLSFTRAWNLRADRNTHTRSSTWPQGTFCTRSRVARLQ